MKTSANPLPKDQQRTKSDSQSVRDFAKELRKPPEVLLEQLRDAGIAKKSASAKLTQADKSALLLYLQNQHATSGRRKKITIVIDSEERKLARRVGSHENGAESEALKRFAELVVFGSPIDPLFQDLVNLILAKAVIVGALPMDKRGRPKRDALESIGLEVAHRYWDLMDAGAGYPETVEMLAQAFSKSERHIMRLVAKHKGSVGETPEIRQSGRSWERLMHEIYRGNPESIGDLYQCLGPMPLAELSFDEGLLRLEERINELAARSVPLTKKI